jgi:virginiamycin B lyase
MQASRSAAVGGAIIILVMILGIMFYSLATNPGQARSSYVKEYSLGGNSSPNAITVDSQGNVWFVLQAETALGMLNHTTGQISIFPLPEPKNTTTSSWGIAVDSSRKLVWFTDQISNSIWSFSIANHTFVRHEVTTESANPYGISLDQNGNVWFTEDWATKANNTYWNKIGEINTSGALKEFVIPHFNGFGNNSEGMAPAGITVDEDGTVWISLVLADSVVSFSNAVFHNYNFTGLAYEPVGIAIGPEGNVWITNHGASFISEFNPRSGYFRSISTSVFPPYNESLPYFIYADKSGSIWFNEHQGNAIARFNPTTNTLTEYEIPSKDSNFGIAGALTMALSSEGSPWFTELFTGKIGTVNATASINGGISVAEGEQSASLKISPSSNATIQLNIIGSGNSGLRAAVSNFTRSLEFNFGPDSGSGNYTSSLVIRDTGAKPGVYFVTISEVTQNLIVSQIVEVEVQ